MGTQKNRLNETVLLSTQNKCLNLLIKKYSQLYAQNFYFIFTYVQYSPFIMLYLGSIGMDRVISDPCYKGTILQRNYRKMTIKWSFSYNSFVKFHGTKIWEPQHDHVISNPVL